MKAVVCIHGFGRNPEGRLPGFSLELRMAVERRLGRVVGWREVLWDDLLGSPDISSSVSMVVDAYSAVCAFYRGDAGDAIRQRVRDVVADVAAEADDGVVLVGHSFGAAIAYDVIARGVAPCVRDLLMMGAPMGLIRRPELFVRNMLGGKMHGLVGLLNVVGDVTGRISGMADIEFGRLPDDMRAAAFRNPEDRLSADLGPAFPAVEQREVFAPPGTRGLEHHRFYWRHGDVANWLVDALSVRRLPR